MKNRVLTNLQHLLHWLHNDRNPMGIKAAVAGIEMHLNMWTPKIQCDECATQYWAHGINPFDSLRDPAKVERVIRDNGWQTVDGRHICPECRQEPTK